LLLTELLTPERIAVPLLAESKEELLQELVRLVSRDAPPEEAADVLRAVREREAVLSTGIGSGVAIPHGKSSTVPDLRMAAGRTRHPVDFDALDGRPVSLLFLLVGPETAAGPHIKALSRISRMVRREAVRDRLLAARTPEEFFDAVKDAEAT
jgi:mannitol/fructose-specific phosphotransferase system IIA component (Ntr-type)